MATFERRKYLRTRSEFKVKIKHARTDTEVVGVTQDISQGGAFISSPSWPIFEKDDQAEMRIFLPPEFTGQTDTLTLTGPGVLRRIDRDKEGVAVEFLIELRSFNPSF